MGYWQKVSEFDWKKVGCFKAPLGSLGLILIYRGKISLESRTKTTSSPVDGNMCYECQLYVDSNEARIDEQWFVAIWSCRAENPVNRSFDPRLMRRWVANDIYDGYELC